MGLLLIFLSLIFMSAVLPPGFLAACEQSRLFAVQGARRNAEEKALFFLPSLMPDNRETMAGDPHTPVVEPQLAICHRPLAIAGQGRPKPPPGSPQANW